MADEISTGANGDVAQTEAQSQTPVTKKQRAPRGQKKAAEQADAAAASTSETVAPRTRRKRGEAPQVAKRGAGKGRAMAAAPEAVAKVGRKRKAATATGQTSPASVSRNDDLIDLIQLEEENKKLRKDLAEKLRQENADLRKRLGLA